MAVLITGGAGYIGSHTCVELLNSGYEIIVVDCMVNSNPEALKRVQEITGKSFLFYEIDLLDRDGLNNIFIENSIETVIHFASLKAIGESVQNPLKYYQNNITGTINLCQTMQAHGVKKLVFSSSATVYGVSENIPITEDFPLLATNPYGRTKLMIEEILRDLYLSDNSWSITLLRYFNPIGAHPSGLIGENPNGVPNNLLPYIAQVAVGKLKVLNVFGSDYATQDGTGVRDYIHVVDLAIGHLKALQQIILDTGRGIHTYNLGSGKGYSVLELLRTFEQASGKTIPYKFVERRPGDVGICYADILKAKKNLGWVAERDIKVMCEDAWNWQINNPNGY
ncbi:UDP-glucose 4-epimerase GalE [Paenibacillus agricola]|uniref:UDP-glucose 4-epimerase n=1 Tax=Paenibacillus agricola TaxID=2716264 RepID=A0ABX0JEE6_9BACL|nr:UDP-glucose 4-epimerase GalE [Paenibacillus agricola]NHN34268.1 UDP-glucose 4-epimerase GalE [Paenibacillus agricola]